MKEDGIPSEKCTWPKTAQMLNNNNTAKMDLLKECGKFSHVDEIAGRATRYHDTHFLA